MNSAVTSRLLAMYRRKKWKRNCRRRSGRLKFLKDKNRGNYSVGLLTCCADRNKTWDGRQNPIGEADLEWIFARNMRTLKQLRTDYEFRDQPQRAGPLYANNEAKSALARDLGDCRDNKANSRSVVFTC